MSTIELGSFCAVPANSTKHLQCEQKKIGPWLASFLAPELEADLDGDELVHSWQDIPGSDPASNLRRLQACADGVGNRLVAR